MPETLGEGQVPKFPVGYTDCVDCHRIVKTEHVNVDGQCSGCEKKTEPLELEPNSIIVTEDDLRDTVNAFHMESKEE